MKLCTAVGTNGFGPFLTLLFHLFSQRLEPRITIPGFFQFKSHLNMHFCKYMIG